MKLVVTGVAFTSIFLLDPTTQAQESYSIGLGLGAMYSGLGVNVSMISDNDLKYLSAGCLSYSNYGGLTCGGGVGWIKTDLIETHSDKHGLGFYAGAVGTKSRYPRSEVLYGVGVGYYYFFNGIAESGTNLGFTLVRSAGDNDNGSGLMLQLGYQF